MTEKQEAKELYFKYKSSDKHILTPKQAKQCALIAVNFILTDIMKQRENITDLTATALLMLQTNRYKAIKKEIEKL